MARKNLSCAQVMLRESQRKNSEMIEAQDLKMEVEETSTGGFSQNKTGEEYRRSGEVVPDTF